MNKIKVFSNFGFEFDYQTNYDCELYIDVFPKTPKNCIRVLWVAEPNEISKLRNIIIQKKYEFDLILTFDEEILHKCDNSKNFVFGTTWIKNFNFDGIKKFCVTSLIGGKSTHVGHKLRHSLLDRISEIKSIQVDLFNSMNTPYVNSVITKKISDNSFKNELFYSQFHIAIENHISKNYFTEKIVDCFQTKTIPIYYGCSNIHEFFDERGIFRVNSLEEIIKVLNNLNEDTYRNLEKYVDINYELSMSYSNIKERLYNELNYFIKKI